MKIVLNIFIIIFLLTVNLKPQVFEWAAKFGGSLDEYARNSVADKDGNIYTVGVFKGTTDFDPGTGVYGLSSSGNWDWFVTKLNSDGQLVWAKRFGAALADEAYAIDVDAEGNVYIGGNFRDTVDFDPGNGEYLLVAKDLDIAICKLNTNGDFVWASRLGPKNNIGYNNVKSLQVDDFNNVYITGDFGGTTDFDPSDQISELTSKGGQDIFVCKLSPGGDLVWSKRMGGTGQDYGKAITIDSNQNVLITGVVGLTAKADFGNFEVVPNSNDIFVSQLDNDGNVTWVKLFIGTKPSSGNGIAVDNFNNVLVTGEFEGKVDFDPDGGLYELTSYANDIFIAKLDNDGNFIWAKQINGTSNDFGKSVTVDDDGNVLTTGLASSNADFDPGVGTYILSESGAFVSKLDSEGNFISAFMFGYPNVMIGNSINLINNNGYVISGEFKKLDNINPLTDFDPGPGLYRYPFSGGGRDVFVSVYKGLSLKDKYLAYDSLRIKWGSRYDSTITMLNIALETASIGVWVGENIPVTEKEIVFPITDNLIDYTSFINIYDASTKELIYKSKPFRIKNYSFTKTVGDSMYVRYMRNKDGFGFINSGSNVWPQSHFSQFNYQGIDPFTNTQYDQFVLDSLFMKSAPDSVPDWPSFVRAFGTDAAYRDLSLGIYNKKALKKWAQEATSFGGICFGFVTANANYFMNRDNFLNKYEMFPDLDSAFSIKVSSNVINTLAELYIHQRGNPHVAYDIANRGKSPNQTIQDLLDMFREDNTIPRGLIMRNNNGGGGHIVNPISIRRMADTTWRISIYDNNFTTLQTILVWPDSGNGRGIWSYNGLSGWGGDSLLFLKDPVTEYLDITPKLQKANSVQSPFALSDTLINISTAYSSDFKITDASGNISGYLSGKIYGDIANSFVDMIDTGTETPPMGFILPTSNYKIELTNFTTNNPKVYLDHGEQSYIYERNDASNYQTDVLNINNGLVVSNPENTTKNSKLITLNSNVVDDKMFIIRSLSISHNDSVKVTQDNENLSFDNYGITKSYNLGIEYASSSREEYFNYEGIQLAENSRHLILPDWNDLYSKQIKILVDLGIDGTVDDTITIANQITGVTNDKSLLNLPNTFYLSQNYPNPFNPITVIKYDLPISSRVVLKIYDILGKEVSELVNEIKPAGGYEVKFDATGFASGIYFYRLQAGDFTETKKMILMK